MLSRKRSGRHSARAVTAIIAALTVSSIPSARASAAAGDLDLKFGIGGKVITHLGFGDQVSALAIQPDGKIIAAGMSASRAIYDAEDFALVRYQTDGTLDSSFGLGGKVITDFFGDEDHISAVALQPDGKIVAAGRARKGAAIYFGLARYDKDGALDSAFGSGGKVVTSFFGFGDDAASLAILADGKILVAGAIFTGPVEVDFGLARYNGDGSLDATFGSGGKVTTDFGNYDTITSIAVQPDGKIIAGGNTTNRNTNDDFALVRYNKDGSLDSGFGSGGKVVTDFARHEDFVAELALQPDGKIVVAGDVTISASPSKEDVGFGLARYNADGSLDSRFGFGGKVVTGDSLIAADAVVIQPNGKVIAAGLAKGGDFGLARYNSNGGLDSGFGTNGVITTDFSGSGGERIFALALQPDGKVVAAGTTFDQNTGSGFALARYDAGDITTRTFDTQLHDDNSLLEFDSTSGDYRFTDCATGFTLTGAGIVKVRSCKIELRDSGSDYYLKAKVKLCSNTGKVSLDVFSQGKTYTLKDKDITDSSSPCR
jgi:uncharacterized delta-60 repeat protein